MAKSKRFMAVAKWTTRTLPETGLTAYGAPRGGEETSRATNRVSRGLTLWERRAGEDALDGESEESFEPRAEALGARTSMIAARACGSVDRA
jgi:hypothetical protein